MEDKTDLDESRRLSQGFVPNLPIDLTCELSHETLAVVEAFSSINIQLPMFY
jgi:hypothetical protein